MSLLRIKPVLLVLGSLLATPSVRAHQNDDPAAYPYAPQPIDSPIDAGEDPAAAHRSRPKPLIESGAGWDLADPGSDPESDGPSWLPFDTFDDTLLEPELEDLD